MTTEAVTPETMKADEETAGAASARESAARESDDQEKDPATEPRQTNRGSTESTQQASRSVAIPMSTLISSAVAAVAVIAMIVLGWLLGSARSEIADRNQQAADNQHAEQVATDYAVGAATIRFDDINAWLGRLKAGTSPQLANKFDATAPKLQDILTPLKWTSTASPISAKVSSSDNGTYKVDVFVNVSSTNAQNPDGAQTTVTYNVTLDKKSGWKITDVGGVNAALPVK